MANHYLQFSEMIEYITPDEMKWWRDKLCALGEIAYQDDITDEQDDLMCAASCFDMEAEGNCIWVVAGEYGNPDAVAAIIQDFLRECRPDDCFTLTWASTCSKMRVGEFGGGGVLVTAQDMHWTNAHAEVESMKNAFCPENKGLNNEQ
jgi:hypothetical protein